MKIGRFVLPLIGCMLIVAACDGQLGTRDIPSPFRERISALHADQIAMAKKCADLQKQIAEMNAQAQWDASQMDVAGSEALNSLGYSNQEYSVDVQKMKILPRKIH